MFQFKINGDRLKKLMKDKNVKAYKLSSKLEELGYLTISPNTITNYMEERTPPKNIEYVKTLADYFNVSTDYLLGISNTPTNNIDIKNFCNEYGFTEETLKKIKTLNKNSLISFNDFINGTHITPYLFEEIYCYSANKNISKNLILFSNLFNYGKILDKYYKEKDYKELKAIFNYFDKFLIEANKYNTTFLKAEYALFKRYIFIEDFESFLDKNNSNNIADIEWMTCELYYFQNSPYGNTRSGGKLEEIDITNYLLYLESKVKEILKNLHKEVAYNKYTISSIFEEYLNRIEGFQYSEDIHKIAKEDIFIKTLNKEQNKLIKEGENNECKRTRKK